MVRKSLLIVGVLVMFALGIIAVGCGDSDEGGNGDEAASPETIEVKCEDACSKQESCGEENFDYDVCVDNCKTFGKYLQSDFFNGVYACVEERNGYCNDAIGEMCMQENMAKCDEPSNLNEFINTMCRRTLECNNQPVNDSTVSQCVQMVRSQIDSTTTMTIMKCLTKSAVSEFNECYLTTDCDNLDQCAEILE